MKNDNELTEKEIIKKIFTTSFSFIHKCEKDSINFYETKRKRLLHQLNLHDSLEPLKFLKKKHENWENERDKLNLELVEVNNDLMEAYERFGNPL